MLILYKKYIYQTKYLNPIPDTISKTKNYSHDFDDYIGIFNRTYIPIYIPVEKPKFYSNQKSYLLQNMLTICDFDIKFIYRLVW